MSRELYYWDENKNEYRLVESISLNFIYSGDFERMIEDQRRIVARYWLEPWGTHPKELPEIEEKKID